MIEMQLSLIVWTVICFLLMMLVLDRLLLKPMLRFMDERQKKIDKAEMKRQQIEEEKERIEKEKIRLLEEKTEKLRNDKESSEQLKREEAESSLIERNQTKQKNVSLYAEKLNIEKSEMISAIDSRSDVLAEEFVKGFLSLADRL